MKAPSKVVIAPYEFAVRFDQQTMAAAGANGACMEDSQLILLAPNNGIGVERETLLHECLHAVWSQTFLDKKYPDDTANSPGEVIISELAPRLFALMRDNPRLVRYLCQKYID